MMGKVEFCLTNITNPVLFGWLTPPKGVLARNYLITGSPRASRGGNAELSCRDCPRSAGRTSHSRQTPFGGSLVPHWSRNERQNMAIVIKKGVKGKVCSTCRKWKQLDDFPTDRTHCSTQGGRHCRCKECHRTKARLKRRQDS